MNLFDLLAFFSMPGGPEWILIGVIALIVFGKRLPEVARSLGKGLVEFKKGLADVESEVDRAGTTNYSSSYSSGTDYSSTESGSSSVETESYDQTATEAGYGYDEGSEGTDSTGNEEQKEYTEGSADPTDEVDTYMPYDTPGEETPDDAPTAEETPAAEHDEFTEEQRANRDDALPTD